MGNASQRNTRTLSQLASDVGLTSSPAQSVKERSGSSASSRPSTTKPPPTQNTSVKDRSGSDTVGSHKTTGSRGSTTTGVSKQVVEAFETPVRAATWTPDERANTCPISGCFAKFGWLTLKHHCRTCGIVVCDSCSKKRIEIDEGQGKERICDTCASKFGLRRRR